jgi:hypothetical protein
VVYRERYAIQRAVLPRVLTLAQVGHVARNTDVDIEVFGFGTLCVMVEGPCALSAYVTGQSPNTAGVCSPPSAVCWSNTADGVEALLNGVLIDRYARRAAWLPTPSRGDAALRIVAPAASDWRLLRGDDDADRLFFERALVMEGDTEMGLVLKNTLDAIGPLWARPRPR